MKIIELLNKIANGEEVPNKVKYGIHYWEYDEEIKDYKDNDDDYVFSYSNYDITDMLNKEIEIIADEEPQEHKIPDKLPYYSLEKIQKAKNKDEWREERISLLEKRIDDYHNKINEILDYLEETK
jgi:hypothetical protein